MATAPEINQASTSPARIVSTPGTCGGKPRIDGHRIRVADVVIWRERRGMTDEEILDAFPSLNLEKIAVAWRYYGDHREEIRELLREEDRFAEKLERDPASVLVRLARAPDVANDPLPPG